MPASTTTKLNTGALMPTLGLGTWRSAPGQVEVAVEHALKLGYRHIDTATGYANEAEVGKGIKASGVPRESIFLTTKLNNPDHKKVEEALEYSLKALGTPYLDLWLMHWPAPMTDADEPDRSIDWIDTWKKMVEVYRKHPQKLKAIGVSNLSEDYLDRLLKNSDLIPAVNQIELHPSCTQEELVEKCRGLGIVVTSYSPLGSQNSTLLTNEIVVELANKYNVTPANILVSLQANKPGVNVLTKSVTLTRIESNMKVIDLTDQEVQRLEAIDKTNHFRVCHPSWTGWGGLGFKDCADAVSW